MKRPQPIPYTKEPATIVASFDAASPDSFTFI